VATRVTPITAARSFARVRERREGRIAILLLLPVAILVIIGLGALLSASSVLAIREGRVDNLYYFKRQMMWTGIGLVALVIGAKIPYRWYARGAIAIYVIALLGLVATLVIGDVRNGSQRWIVVGPATIQASEFAKFAVIAMLATILARKEHHLNTFAHVFWPVAVTIGMVGVLLMKQPDFGTTALIALSSFVVLIASAAPLRYIASLGVLGSAAGAFFALTADYRLERVTSFLNAKPDILGNGFQVNQSLVALGTGGWFGVGLGASRARWSFLPNAHTDFIFAIIGEETGLAGSWAVIGLFIALAVVGTAVALRARDEFGRLLAVGIVAWLTFQALINIGGVTKALPITGVPLPFVSSGGSAMVANLFVIGILINIARAIPARVGRKMESR